MRAVLFIQQGPNMKRTIGTLAFTMLTAWCASDVAAEEYPGVNCKYYGKQGSDAYFDPNGYAANGLKNADTSSRYAVCPLVSPNAPIDTIVVRMGTASDVCKVYQKDNTNLSQTVYSRSWYLTDPASGLTMHVFTIGQSGGYPGGTSYTIYCNVPAGGVIRGYGLRQTI